jgi:DUF1009 family protein
MTILGLNAFRGDSTACLIVDGRRLLRSATSIGVNYREVSRADFANKIATVQKEGFRNAVLAGAVRRHGHYEETADRPVQRALEVLAIFTAIGKKLKL